MWNWADDMNIFSRRCSFELPALWGLSGNGRETIIECAGRGGSAFMEAKEITDEELCRIKISCRCGTQSIAEIPESLTGALHVHVCPNCKGPFGIRKQDDDWKIGRMC
jgi:hypothetical protein